MSRRISLVVGFGCLMFPIGARAATLRLVPDQLKADVGTKQEVRLVVDAGGDQLVGLDAKIVWPGNLIKLVEMRDLRGFSGLLGRKDVSGRVDLAFGNEYGVFSQGKVEVANLVFETMMVGSGEIGLEFEKGATTDSNLVAVGGADVLSGVRGVEVEVADRVIRETGKVLGSQSDEYLWLGAIVLLVGGTIVYRRAGSEV